MFANTHVSVIVLLFSHQGGKSSILRRRKRKNSNKHSKNTHTKNTYKPWGRSATKLPRNKTIEIRTAQYLPVGEECKAIF